MDSQRLARLFDAAVEMPPEQADEWLKRECGEDQALLQAARRLLRADAKAAGFLHEPLDIMACVASGAEPEAPERFGPYRVLRSLGAGGMGEVWLGERVDGGFEQRVAIKQLAYPTPGLLQRFRQERQILAQLEHPGIARLLDGGADAHGAPYLVMEYVEGEPITRHAQEHALDLTQKLNLFLQVCAAVQYAHQNLIVHRDLKPSNILVTADGSVKLLDFGIAKLLATTDPDTRTATRLMTPGYAAPEQMAGAPITTATDVYALGVLLHELLTGTKPVREGGRAGPETTRPPSLTSTITDRRQQRALRGDLDRIVLTALAVDPHRRYASPAILAQDILLHAEGRPITARGHDRWYRVRRALRRHRYVYGSALVIFVVLLAAALISLEYARQAQAEAIRANAVRKMLVGLFQQASPSDGKAITAQSLLENGMRQIDDITGQSPELKSDLIEVVAELYTDIGDYERAEALLKPLLVDATPNVPDAVRLRALRAASDISERNGAWPEALGYLDRADRLAAGSRRVDAGDVEELLRRRAAVTVSMNAARGEPLAREAWHRDLERHGRDSEEAATTLDTLARALGELGRHAEAIDGKREVLRIERSLHGEPHADVAAALNSLGVRLRVAGEQEEALAVHQQALAMQRALSGPDHPSTLQFEGNLLQAMLSAGRYRDALPRLEALLARMRGAVGDTDQRVSWILSSLALARVKEGDYDGAIAARRESIALSERLQGAGSREAVIGKINLGNLYNGLGEYVQAEALLRDALATVADKSEQKAEAYARFRLARALLGQAKTQEAIDLVQAMADSPRSEIKANESIRAIAKGVLAMALAQSGRGDEAVEVARSGVQVIRNSGEADAVVLAEAQLIEGEALLAAARPQEALVPLRNAEAAMAAEYADLAIPLLRTRVALADALSCAGGDTAAAQALLDRVHDHVADDRYPYRTQLREHSERIGKRLP